MQVSRLLCISFLPLLLVANLPTQQSPPKATEDFGYLNVIEEHVSWPAPETIVNDLLSSDDATRLKAMRLLGLDDRQAHWHERFQVSPSGPVTERVVVRAPDQVQLTYAALGRDKTQQAIIAISSLGTMYAAVAMPESKGWMRIATIDCGCRYNAGDLSDFAQIRPSISESEERFELVMRSSDGGSGILVQEETHFRADRGKLHGVMSFVGRTRNCQVGTCTLEKRWFQPTLDGMWVLVAGHGKFAENQAGDLEDRFLQHATCTYFKWDDQTFQFKPTQNTSNPCPP